MTGTIQNREIFLEKIANRLGREPRLSGVKRPIYKYQPQLEVMKDASQDELVVVLKEICSRIHTDFYATSLQNLPSTLKSVLHSFGGGATMITKDERFAQYGINKLLQHDLVYEGNPLYEWNPEKGDENIALAEKANIGITFSEMTLAESATVVLFANPQMGRSVSLLPKTYIAIIPKSTIVPRMTQAAQYIREIVKLGQTVPSSINFISGPSNSADIEMNLVVGVHGPVKAAYIVVEDK
ncbi:LutC/YkgG family protein [Bacillus massiliigorillae]|uniref:LutC/YkgG family protein n=1 Tax=Bacillus massiliigorillae TaxID=1243664 RepID=UPI00039B7F0B|nr:lactate utilization protein C [Bacillus massiliigorillae]